MPKDEESLIEKLKQGDIKSFDHVFKLYYAGLYQYANSFIHNSEITSEIVQDVFVRFWNHGKIPYINSTLKGYLYRMTHNQCLNYLRGTKSQKNIKFLSIEDFQDKPEMLLLEINPSILDTLFSEQFEAELNKALESLPNQCREIFKLCRFHDLSYPEVAKHLNISLSTVKTQMNRAMAKLIDSFDKYFDK